MSHEAGRGQVFGSDASHSAHDSAGGARSVSKALRKGLSGLDCVGGATHRWDGQPSEVATGRI